jgi:hypothetical protein
VCLNCEKNTPHIGYRKDVEISQKQPAKKDSGNSKKLEGNYGFLKRVVSLSAASKNRT